MCVDFTNLNKAYPKDNLMINTYKCIFIKVLYHRITLNDLSLIKFLNLNMFCNNKSDNIRYL